MQAIEEDTGDGCNLRNGRIRSMRRPIKIQGVLRISLDTKATVKVGPFSRGGYSRHGEYACDHDFKADTTLTPFGILLPQTGDNHCGLVKAK